MYEGREGREGGRAAGAPQVNRWQEKWPETETEREGRRERMKRA